MDMFKKIDRAYGYFHTQAIMGLYIFLMLRLPRFYAWITKDDPVLRKEQEERNKRRSQKAGVTFRQVGLQQQRRDWSGYIIAAALVVAIIATLVVLRPNPFP